MESSRRFESGRTRCDLVHVRPRRIGGVHGLRVCEVHRQAQGSALRLSGRAEFTCLNGLYDAKLDGRSVAITGHVFHDLIDTHTQQDVDLDKLFADVSIYNTRVMGASHVRNVTELACRKALYHRGRRALEFSGRLADQSSNGHSKRNVPNHVSAVDAHARGCPRKGNPKASAEY